MTLTVEIGAIAALCMVGGGGMLFGTECGRQCLFGSIDRSRFNHEVAQAICVMNDENAVKRREIIDRLQGTLDANITRLESFIYDDHSALDKLKHTRSTPDITMSAITKASDFLRQEVAKAQKLYDAFLAMRNELGQDQQLITERIDAIQQDCNCLFEQLDALHEEKETWRRATIHYKKIISGFDKPSSQLFSFSGSFWGNNKSYWQQVLERLDYWLTQREQDTFIRSYEKGVS